MRHLMTAGLVCALILSLGAASAELSINLTVEDTGGNGGRECVTSGVPLLPGQCTDVSTLRLLNEKGEEVPAQFRALARWHKHSVGPGPKDGSVRWVLVDFIPRVRGFGTRTFTLTDGKAGKTDSPLAVKQTDDRITVTTGPAEFVINRKEFNLFDRVRIDLNGDGKYAADEECVSPGKSPGSVVEDTYGKLYYSSQGVREVVVEEAGPVRVCVVAKGVHRAPGGGGYSRGMYQYDTRLHFYAGKSLVKVDHVLNNCFPEPIGTPTFEDHSLVVKLNMEGEASNNPKMKDAGKFVMYRVYGVAPLDDGMQAGESVCLYQDSNGSETWKINPGVQTRADVPRFRGYRILERKGEKETVVTGGDHARGIVEFHGKRYGLVVIPRYFWQKFPKAIEASYDGTARIGVLPREYKQPHWLQDASGAGMRLWLYFWGHGGARQYARDNQTKSKWWQLLRDRPWPHVIADSLIPERFARCTNEQYAATGALADVGAYEPISGGAAFPLEITERRYFMTDYLKGNAYGWQVFGCRWEEQKGHSPANYEPIGSSDYLFRYINTGHPSWLEFGLRRDLHFRDVRAYKIDDNERFRFKTWGTFRGHAECEDYCSRGKMMPKDAEAKKYQKGRWGRTGWYLPNPAHNCLDELFDLYCLFGDTRALEGMQSVAAVGGYYIGGTDRSVGIHRATGWCMRALLRYYELTGAEDARHLVDGAADNAWKMVRANNYDHMPRINYKNTWFYNVFGRAVVLHYRSTGDERMRDLAIGMTQMRTKKSQHPTLNAFCYEQTGQEKYFSDRAKRYARVGGYFPACAAHLWLKPRPDKVAPAAVQDLSARAGDGGITLSWTAPGDDGHRGTASVYQIKWSENQIVESADHTSKCNFWAAHNVDNEPEPKKGGTRQTMTVKGLKPGTYTFALKARDELNNESGISNVVTVEVK